MNKNKIVALFLLTGLLASCSNKNIQPLDNWSWQLKNQKTEQSFNSNTEKSSITEEASNNITETVKVKENIPNSSVNNEVKSKITTNNITKSKIVTEIKVPQNDNKVADNNLTTIKKETISTTNTSSVVFTNEIKKIDPVILKKLSINNKCIWCGRCVKFSSANFSFDSSSNKAIVISQAKIYSWKISNAIDRCPVWAISIS